MITHLQTRRVIPVIRYKTRLQEHRERAKLTKMDLVREAKVANPTINAWENSKEGLERMDARVAQAFIELLGVDYNDLVYVVQIAADGTEKVIAGNPPLDQKAG